MLTATFLHAQGIGEVTERRLWDHGFTSWQQVLSVNPRELPLTDAQRALLLPVLEQSVVALEEEDFGFFARMLPHKEHWRAAPKLMDRIGFLDIETNGGYSADSITVIGVYNGDESRIYLKGRDLEEFAHDAGKYALWVTFFGTGFDLPFLRRRFPDLALDQMHIDLCPALRRLGYKGGLKRIEQQLGISREDEIDGMSGYDAVRLWREWRSRKNQEALDLLIAYNRADIENMALLLAFTYQRLKTLSGFPA
ncbi:MAG: ribonuclease H-like domain-containing protein [Armatimonadota bacterium]